MKPSKYREQFEEEVGIALGLLDPVEDDYTLWLEEQLTERTNQVDRLTSLLDNCKNAFLTLPEKALGECRDDTYKRWYIRDELIHNIKKVIKEVE
ncbi:MAG TPA: hypothetical protein VK031_08710 [Tissierellaceae bacterium]|nr:hypothetical protein [Tissierellaceae bacterium]